LIDSFVDVAPTRLRRRAELLAAFHSGREAH
jgi:hypothetical protein